MEITALEEHDCLPETDAARKGLPPERRDLVLDFGKGRAVERSLEDLGQARIDVMDRIGVDIEVLSLTTPRLQVFEPDAAVVVARAGNAAAAIAVDPARFQARVTLPTPASAADDVAGLKHRGRNPGFEGALRSGRTLNRNPDHPAVLPVFTPPRRTARRAPSTPRLYPNADDTKRN